MAAAHLSLSCFLNLRFRFSINLPASLRFELETLTEPYESACDHLRQIASVRGVANHHQQFEALQDALYAYLQHLTAGYLCFVLLSIRPHPFFPDDLNPVAPIFILDRIFHPGDPLQEVEEEQNEQTGQSCTVERLYQHSPQVIALKEMVVGWVQNLIGDIRRESHQLNHQDYYDDWQQEAIHWAEESTVMTGANRFMACLQEMAAAQQTAINAFAQRVTTAAEPVSTAEPVIRPEQRECQLITSSHAIEQEKSMSDTEEHKNETLGNEEQNKPASEFVENPGVSSTVRKWQLLPPLDQQHLRMTRRTRLLLFRCRHHRRYFRRRHHQATTSDQDPGTSSTLPTTEQLQASYHLLWEAIHKHFTVPTEWAMVAIRFLVSAIKRRTVGGQEPNLPELQKQFDELVDAVATFSLLLREVIHQQVDTRSFTTPLASSSSSSSMSYYAYILPPPTPRIKWASLAEYVDALEAQMLKLFDAGQEDDDENGNAEDARSEHAIEGVPEGEEDEGRLRQLKEDFCMAVETMITSLGQAICELKFDYHGEISEEELKVIAEEAFQFYVHEWNRGFPPIDSGGSTTTTTFFTPMTPETLSKGHFLPTGTWLCQFEKFSPR
ncbi:hypothetical protein TYRP_020669 [Tyrophagus putrescentiae]|nr:hypothetical protein TYRP_020669 [Tyrophagus putrescentiae]